jgi:hypothetical protein
MYVHHAEVIRDEGRSGGNYLLFDAAQLGEHAENRKPMLPEVREHQLQVIARRCGLKIVVDRCSTNATGQRSLFSPADLGHSARRSAAIWRRPRARDNHRGASASRNPAHARCVEHVLKDWNEPELDCHGSLAS